MGSLTNYAELVLLNHIFSTAYTPPVFIYAGLLTADPTETGSTANEVSGNNYARKPIEFWAASGRSITQAGQVDFPECTPSGWGALTHFGIFDADTGGNMLAYGSLEQLPTVFGNRIFIPDGTLTISVNPGAASDYLANILLDFMFRNQPFDQPNIHIALCDADPTDAGTGSTISEPGGNYARADFADWTTAVDGVVKNNTHILFSPTIVQWPIITHSAIVDNSVGGNLLIYNNINPNQQLELGDGFRFPVGAYLVQLG